MRRWAITLFGGLIAAGLSASCSGGGLVGGECLSGTVACGGVCVDIGEDPDNCGACGVRCAADESCIVGVCMSEEDGNPGVDGGVGGSGGSSAEPLVAHGSSSGSDDPGALFGDAQGFEADYDKYAGQGYGARVPADAGFAGAGGSVSGGGFGSSGGSAGSSSAGDGGSGFAGAGGSIGGGGVSAGSGGSGTEPDGGSVSPSCQVPFAPCGDECVDLQTDPMHCGQCGMPCASGLCESGECVGATVGHAVLICADFSRSFARAPQTQILANAVFLPNADPVRILAYGQHTPSNVAASVRHTLGWAAASKDRAYVLTEKRSSVDLGEELDTSSYDVLLVYDQPDAPEGALSNIGSALNRAADSFMRAGGTIVVLSSDRGTGEMGDFLTSSGLLDVTGLFDATGSVLYNLAPGDAVGLNVLSPFLALDNTCTFATGAAPSEGTAYVVGDAPALEASEPAVVHRVIDP